MKKHQLFIATSISVFFVIIAGGIWYWKENKQDGEVNVESKTQKISVAPIDGDINLKSQVIPDFGDQSTWVKYSKKEFGITLKHPRGWFEEFSTSGEGRIINKKMTFSWKNMSLTILPTGGFNHGIPYSTDHADVIVVNGKSEDMFTREYSDGSMYSYMMLKNYQQGWNNKNYIEIKYTKNMKETIQNVLKSITFGKVTDSIDAFSSELYGGRVGLQGSMQVDTENWLTEENNSTTFLFRYPKGAIVTNEGNCYRVEYELGFVIFFIPVEGYNRCGARTGVGILPDNVHVTDYLTIEGEKYEVPGFHAVADTQGETFYKLETRYSYDFHHMFNLNKNKDCSNANGCLKVGYGIYKEVSTPFNKEDIDNTMDTLRSIVESVKYKEE